MRELFATVIRKGGFDLSTMLRRIDEYHVEGKLTDEEREELTAAARGDAAPQVDASGEVQLLWAAVRDLTARVAALEGSAPDDTGAEEIPAFSQPTGAHDAYYTGDRVTYQGMTYECVAPEGVACAWSPDVMPGYWQVMGDV